MLTTLIEIAWGDRANFLNQIFSIFMLLIILIQALRYFMFWDRINQWSRAFVSAKIAFDREKTVQLESRMDELQPPHSASDQLWIVIPPIIIMFGLIGTFIGLTLALAVIPFGGTPAEIQIGVQKALPSMGSAFWTSLTAICSALTIRLTTMLMESMFKRRVLNVIVTAHPQLIQYIEREAFFQNRPGALLRPHSLREVLWQQNIEFTKQIHNLGETISSSIRALPLSLPVYEAHSDDLTKHSDLTDMAFETAADQGSNSEMPVSDEGSSETPHHKGTSSVAVFTQDRELTSHENLSPLLKEMKKQTRLLELILINQQREQNAQRITKATQSFRSVDLTPYANDEDWT